MISQSGTGCGDPGGPPRHAVRGSPACPWRTSGGGRLLGFFGREERITFASFPPHGNDLGGLSRLDPPLAKGDVRLLKRQGKT